jgi:hypothetical protein
MGGKSWFSKMLKPPGNLRKKKTGNDCGIFPFRNYNDANPEN